MDVQGYDRGNHLWLEVIGSSDIPVQSSFMLADSPFTFTTVEQFDGRRFWTAIHVSTRLDSPYKQVAGLVMASNRGNNHTAESTMGDYPAVLRHA